MAYFLTNQADYRRQFAGEPALQDLDAIADHPRLGPKHPELRGWQVRQIVEPPCRVLYREHDRRVVILHVMRVEQRLVPEYTGP